VTAEASATPRLEWREARIERLERRSDRVVGVFLRVPLARHEAGQHVDIRLTGEDGYQAERSYSIASAPGSPHVELVIERLEDGEVSPYFHGVAAPGDTIEMRGPIGGHFIWRPGDGGPLLLVAGGSGVAPLMSIARHRAATSAQTSALLLYSARTRDEILFHDELLATEAAQRDFTFIAATTRGPPPRPSDFNRRIDAAVVREALSRWGREPRHVFVCGSNRFVEAAANALIDNGVAAARIRTERYGGES
jgi:ferredoxin-NADP reductase